MKVHEMVSTRGASSTYYDHPKDSLPSAAAAPPLLPPAETSRL